jgi:acyl-CoA synthetase (AMP-forming)/AMP-acid ligase II
MRPASRLLPGIPRLRPRLGRDPARRMVMPFSLQPTERDFASVAELLRRRAVTRPRQAAFAYVLESADATGSGEVVWTYAELDRRASAVAAQISRHAEPGDRAVLAFPPGLDFIASFFGCLYAGILPVPATYPKPRRPSARLDGIVEDCDPKLALTTANALSLMRLDAQSPAVRGLSWLAVDELPTDHAPTPLVPRGPEDLAFLQYTSGSTSQPRGVKVTHGNLLHNVELIRTGFRLPAADSGEPPATAVFWLPAYHDMGLIGGILAPMYLDLTSYLLAPATFLQRPITWLETISRTRASVSGAPNFAYELCTRKISPD